MDLPLHITFAHRDDDANKEESTELVRQPEKDGLFEVTEKAVEWQAFQKGYAAGDYDAYTLGRLPDYPDPDTFSQPLVGSENSLHDGYTSEKTDALIASPQMYSDRGRTSDDFKELQRLVGEDVPLVPLWQKKDYVVSKQSVSGSPYLSDGTGIWRLGELSWI